MSLRSVFDLLIALLAIAPACSAADTEPVRIDQPSVQQFLSRHCASCHDSDSAEAGLDVTQLGNDLSDEGVLARWVQIHDRIASGEMPPADADQPSAQERQVFTTALASTLTAGHAAEKGTVLRRLNRREYQNALNDIFGTNLNLEALLPEDGRSHEFDNVGSALSISMVQMQRYLEAIDAVLDAAIATTVERPEQRHVKASYADSREGERFIGNQWLKLDDGAVVFFRRAGYPSGMLRGANTKAAGFYRVRVTGYAHQSDRPVTFSVGATTFARGLEKPTFGYYEMPPGEPATIELTAWIESNYMIQIEPYGINDRNEIKKNGIENYTGPGLAILNVEVDGPLIDEFPTRGHRLLFDGLNRSEKEPANPSAKKKSWYQAEFEISGDKADSQMETVLTRVASAAFRRPATRDTVAPYLELYTAERDSGSDVEDALRTVVSAIFCSPDFLFLQESPGLLDDYALASRLAFFLTRSTPDQQLLDLAAAGRLTSDPEILREQTERLLNHPHYERLIIDLTDSWLNLRDIEFTAPDKDLFPEFDSYLQHSMLEETRAFLSELIRNNHPVRTIVDSDFAMLNERLADHYNISGVHGPQIRKTDLPEDSVRGGFLSQASVLKVSANGTNTSPVVRGVWVMERIMGQAPPPPPPGIPGVEPDIRGASTLRELLDQHRDVSSCRSCHEMIDPPGFALECFNPVGTFRTRFRSLGQGDRVNLEINGRKVRYKLGQPVDASGTLKDGRSFAGFREFRDFLATDQELLARAFITKLLIFGSGREMGFSDRNEIDRIVADSRERRFGIRDMIHEVVQSSIFRSK